MKKSSGPWSCLATLISVILTLAVLATPVLLYDLYKKRTFLDYVVNNQNIRQIIETEISASRISRLEKDSQQYIYWALPRQRGNLIPSGPPVLIFDEKGNLCDYTFDEGDDLRFREKWLDERRIDGKFFSKREEILAQKIPLSELIQKFYGCTCVCAHQNGESEEPD